MSLPLQRFLIADDDREVREGVMELLESLRLEVVEAESGLEALELARLRPIDAALLDLHMPGCSGLEALPLLRRDRLDLPCIVYSGNWTPALERQAMEAGALSVLRKPVVPDLLRQEVRRALGLTGQGFPGQGFPGQGFPGQGLN